MIFLLKFNAAKINKATVLNSWNNSHTYLILHLKVKREITLDLQKKGVYFEMERKCVSSSRILFSKRQDMCILLQDVVHVFLEIWTYITQEREKPKKSYLGPFNTFIQCHFLLILLCIYHYSICIMFPPHLDERMLRRRSTRRSAASLIPPRHWPVVLVVHSG